MTVEMDNLKAELKGLLDMLLVVKWEKLVVKRAETKDTSVLQTDK